jgi:hypothetical protein
MWDSRGVYWINLAQETVEVAVSYEHGNGLFLDQ